MRLQTTSSGVFISNATLWQLLAYAYRLKTREQVLGLPGWGDTTQFDILAKMDDDTSSALHKLSRDDRSRKEDEMFQMLLRDRFRLQIHSHSRELPIYEHTVDKNGSKMSPSSASSAEATMSMGNGTLTSNSIEMTSLAYSLSSEVDRIVLDKTGLKGKYVVNLRWNPKEQQRVVSAQSEDLRPSLFTALREQLGLRLNPTRGMVETMDIDHVEHPSNN